MCPHEIRFGPRQLTEDEQREQDERFQAALLGAINRSHKEISMHYRNGREAKNGDKIVKLEGGKVVSFGVLHSAQPGNDYCNGNIAAIQPPNDYACMVDCLHVEDVAVLLAEKGLDKRAAGK